MKKLLEALMFWWTLRPRIQWCINCTGRFWGIPGGVPFCSDKCHDEYEGVDADIPF